MNVLYLTSELAPFAKTGGLADVSAALPRQLHRHGHDVRVFLPFYARIEASPHVFTVLEGLRDIPIRLGPHRYKVSILTGRLPGSDLDLFFVHCPVLYSRASLYTSDVDEHLRFLVLCRAALAYAQRTAFSPDVIHCNDWQTALVPLLLKARYAWDLRIFSKTKTLLAIHNLNYQGGFRAGILPDTGLSDSAHLFHQEQLGRGVVSFLSTGVLYADGIVTVSPTYAKEIQTPEHGAGLDGLLRARSSTVVGILNGIDDEEWNPATDPLIFHRYSAQDLGPKEQNKRTLLEKAGLRHWPGIPLVGIVSRLASQKGFDLMGEVLPPLLRSQGFQLIVLGSGEPRFEKMFRELEQAFPAQVRFRNGFSNEVAHWIEAGADLFLMPSRYEPCGLNQMYSLRYGTVPIVRRTGGLADTVEQWDPQRRTGNGIVFDQYDATGLDWALRTAIGLYKDEPSWRQLRQNGMMANHSWATQAALYEQLYSRLLALP